MCNKNCLTKREAQESLNQIKKHRGRRYRRECRIYQCNEHKGYWHLTSSEEYEEREEIPLEKLIYKDKWIELKSENPVEK